MMLKKVALAVGLMVAMFSASSIASADPGPGIVMGRQANGTGKLHNGGTLGFNAKPDLSGSIEYHSPDGTLTVHCNDLRGYFDRLDKKGFKDATFGSDTCTDPGGQNSFRVWIDALDCGEGSNAPQDKVHIRVFDSQGTLLFEERGAIQNGNVQVHL
jgi:hypothetical protein